MQVAVQLPQAMQRLKLASSDEMESAKVKLALSISWMCIGSVVYPKFTITYFDVKYLCTSSAAERAAFVESVMLFGPEQAPATKTPSALVCVGSR